MNLSIPRKSVAGVKSSVSSVRTPGVPCSFLTIVPPLIPVPSNESNSNGSPCGSESTPLPLSARTSILIGALT